ncbi:MAG: NADPH-dependent glutamate synthase [Deltaproteobacteria bacterium]|nr:NADPH-dependent glutamate synthase [Deltaproteobacteria bacterium]
MPEQDPHERRKNFREVPHGLPPMTAVLEANRCIRCKKPGCVQGCPVGIDIPGFVGLVAAGDFLGGIRKMKETNMLPAICGRVCPQEEQCEKVCVTGKKGKPVAIGRLERFVADWEREQGKMETPLVGKPSGKSVGVVGCGPAGLTVAIDLRRAGHAVTIYEALHAPGGVLMYGIPEFRLPKKIVAAEVDVVSRMGVEIRYDYVVGKLETVDDLLKKHDAIFLGTGAGLPWFMGIPGENLCGVYSANEYLTRSNLMRAYDFPNCDTPIARSKRVAVVGGGNVAMDSARTAVRLGAEEVYLVYRRSETEMPARIEEIHHAKEEGIIFKILHNPVRYIGDDKGRVKQVECVRMELGEPDASGRRRPIVVKGSEFLIDVDTVVVAIGNGPNPLVPRTTRGLDVDPKKGTVMTDLNTMRTSKKGVFAGGDIAIGAATVILAMGHGRKAARSINHYLETGVWDIKYLPGEEPKTEQPEAKGQ